MAVSLSTLSRICLYTLIFLLGINFLLIFRWQIKVLRGSEMKNPDGSVDSWNTQKSHYGIAFADVFLSCPAGFIGIILTFFLPRVGLYLIALVSFWLLWANIMTTVTSLRFEKPCFSLDWFATFPFGALVGLGYLCWYTWHFIILF